MKSDKQVLITGATSGVGLELAKHLAAAGGYSVMATGRNGRVLEELKAYGIEGFCADLRDPEQIDWLVSRITPPDIVIFSAGVGRFSYAAETADEEIEEMISINVQTPMLLTKRLLPNMIDRKSGHLLYIGSQAGKVATPKTSVYAATKHALIGYTNALRMEAAPYHIDVSVIHPGPVDTPFIALADRTGGYKEALGSRILSAGEVVQAVMDTIRRPRREINLPAIMGITSKLYGLAPGLVEAIGKPFFYKK